MDAAALKTFAIANRPLPTFNPDLPNQSIKLHLKELKARKRALTWTDEELAENILLSLRGVAKTLANTLNQDTLDDPVKLEQFLESVYSQQVAKEQLIRELETLRFNPVNLTLKEFVIRVAAKYHDLGVKKEDESNLLIRSKILDCLNVHDPDFTRYARMNQSSTDTFNEWAEWLSTKFENHQFMNRDQGTDTLFLTQTRAEEGGSHTNKPPVDNRMAPPSSRGGQSFDHGQMMANGPQQMTSYGNVYNSGAWPAGSNGQWGQSNMTQNNAAWGNHSGNSGRANQPFGGQRDQQAHVRVCFYCGRPGHIRRDCRTRMRDERNGFQRQQGYGHFPQRNQFNASGGQGRWPDQQGQQPGFNQRPNVAQAGTNVRPNTSVQFLEPQKN